ncbi:hypothetical protein [Thermosediminibacter oceani]|uniref:Uncharacterized protein n=1 Tax=Thermosediminibacter oceani (strain ATCC BAA-1034 / DSM 16646 / JW/IW-1228P) TaxID=555079 RepID=D9S1I3_THEOJ|nr:hypothetical protein [Thermosediminibacter oceani]ADL07260.1 hypothetical protein Toce_0484 [Thermosediminibacter oceani DSM 16646]
MTREELKKVLEEIETLKGLIRKELGDEAFEERSVSSGASTLKNTLRRSIKSGEFKSTLLKISGSLDFTKSAIGSISQIVEKAREKINGESEKASDLSQIAAMGSAWFPMFLSLMQAPEFQNLTASMLANMLKDEAS